MGRPVVTLRFNNVVQEMGRAFEVRRTRRAAPAWERGCGGSRAPAIVAA